MAHHVFAVWDFMSLLKTLQARFTCTTVPWEPRGSADTRRFINELVTEEESDVHPRDGGFTSHFELYREAMLESQADTGPIDAFVDLIRQGVAPAAALTQAGAPTACRDFVLPTLGFVAGDSNPQVTAAFALGREQLIPTMFAPLKEAQQRFPDQVDLFVRCRERHIQLDSEDHGDSEANWHDARVAAEAALRARLGLWDATAQAMEQSVLAAR